MKIAIFTAIFWEYDTLLEQSSQTVSCEFICLTDDWSRIQFQNEKAKNQRRIYEVRRQENLSDRLNARYVKTHLRLFAPDADVVIRMDAMGILLQPKSLDFLLSQFKYDIDILLFQHPNRICTYDEAEFIKTLKHKKFKWLDVDSQMAKYRNEGYPKHFWLSATTLMISRNTEKVVSFMEMWRYEIQTQTNRDQLSFDYCVWKSGLKVEWFSLGYWNNLRVNRYVSFLTGHKKSQ